MNYTIDYTTNDFVLGDSVHVFDTDDLNRSTYLCLKGFVAGLRYSNGAGSWLYLLSPYIISGIGIKEYRLRECRVLLTERIEENIS